MFYFEGEGTSSCLPGNENAYKKQSASGNIQELLFKLRALLTLLYSLHPPAKVQ
jgi:hypothetical protein